MTATSILSGFIGHVPLEAGSEPRPEAAKATNCRANERLQRPASAALPTLGELTGLLKMLSFLARIRIMLSRGNRNFRVTKGGGKIVEGLYQACHLCLGSEARPLQARLYLLNAEFNHEYVVELDLADIKDITGSFSALSL